MKRTSPLDGLVADLKSDRDRLRSALDRVPASGRDWRPKPECWSVAGVLEHLAIVEQRAVKIVADLVAAAPPIADGSPGTIEPMVFDRTLLRDRTQRVMAPEMIQPTGRVSAEEAWASLEHSRVALIEAIRGGEGRDLSAVSRVHPRLGPLNGYQWIAAIGGHEERHAAQIDEIAVQLRARSRAS